MAEACNQRRLLLVTGNKVWARQCVTAATEALSEDEVLWVSNHPPAAVSSIGLKQATQVLGGERHMVVFDAQDGFDADALGAVSGLVCGGGLFLLLAPALAEWPSGPDAEARRFMSQFEESSDSHFIERLIHVLCTGEGAYVVAEDAPLPSLESDKEQLVGKVDNTNTLFASYDQRDAVEAIVKATSLGNPVPCVLVSDRGRGKSAALGIAAAQLLKQGIKRVAVTAPRLSAVDAVFEHASRLLPDTHYSKSALTFHDARLQFVAPDELIVRHTSADVLLVDEAAAIPAPMLNQLLENYPRIVFATTVHGYEGSGRGFALRFNKVLDAKTPGWERVRMETPVRWGANDPMERLIFDALLMNAGIASESELSFCENNEIIVERLTGAQLVKDERMLRELFGLLVLAHYRTRPNDLRQLLDSQVLTIFVMRKAEAVIGTALVIEEGGLEPELVQAVYQGHRRLRGHLVPQALATYVGMPDAATFKYARIMRIAVHPQLQCQGFGSQLLEHVVNDCQQRGFDLAATSFGATPELMKFWQKLGFVMVRMGLKREHSSGTHSAVMLRPLNKIGTDVVTGASARFHKRLPYLLKDQLRDLDSAVIERISVETPQEHDVDLHEAEQRDLHTFAHASLGAETVLPPLHVLAGNYFSGQSNVKLDAKEECLLRSKVLNYDTWSIACSVCGVSGKKEGLTLLRKIVLKLISD